MRNPAAYNPTADKPLNGRSVPRMSRGPSTTASATSRPWISGSRSTTVPGSSRRWRGSPGSSGLSSNESPTHRAGLSIAEHLARTIRPMTGRAQLTALSRGGVVAALGLRAAQKRLQHRRQRVERQNDPGDDNALLADAPVVRRPPPGLPRTRDARTVRPSRSGRARWRRCPISAPFPSTAEVH
jgi:hypothetical protein